MKKIEDILFYTATRVQPPKEGLEKIINELPVTNLNRPRYSYVMGSRFVLPIGIAILVLLVFFSAKNSKTQTVLELPATVTKQNVNDSINKVDASVSTSMDEMDKDLNEIDQDNSSVSQEDSNGEIDQIENEQETQDGSSNEDK
ncbi:MAG TPA: hypothetical protein VFA93_03000 [Patescibacteria group bacterium]|nr:hypothetical protein [Patescibacteria group bacterium]